MDKNKILDSAAKLVAKGAYDKAIREYQRVLDADPRDVRVLHKLGELYEKKNDAVQAAVFFTRVADGYASDGFSMKAIALYKKVLKLDPNLIDVNIKLAELHQQHQLMSEAMAYYQAVANHHEKQGDIKASLDTLRKMVDLDPENVASRIKLAELFARQNLNKEAAVEFRRAADYLKRNNRIDDYLRVAERLCTLEPESVELSRDLASHYLQRGDQKRALAKLQVCFKADPQDIDTLQLLAQAFQGLGQASKTLSVYKELVRLYTEKGRVDEANRIWTRVGQLDPNDPDLLARQKPQGAPAAGPAPRAAAPAASLPSSPPPKPAAAAPPPGGLSRDQLGKLLTETDVYVKYGLHDKALEHLRRVFAVDPENLDAHEKAYQIYVSAGNDAAAGEQLLNVLRLCTRRAEVDRAQPYLATILNDNPSHPEVPAFLAVLRTAQTEVPAQAEHDPVPEDAILVESSEEEIVVSDAPDDALLTHGDDLAIHAAQGAPEDDEVIDTDERSGLTDDALVASDEGAELVDEPAFASGDDEPLALTGDDEALVYEEPASAEIVVDDVELGVGEVQPTDEAPAQVVSNVAADTFVDDEVEYPSHGEEPVEAPPDYVDEVPLAVQHAEPAVYEEAADEQPAYEQAAYEQPVDAQPAYEQAAYEQPADAQPAYEQAAYEQPADAQPAYEQAAYEQPVDAQPSWEEPPAEVAESSAAQDAPAEEPATEECDEAAFFIEQGMFEEAREILETVQIAYPDHVRAASLMEELERQEAGGAAPAPEEPPAEEAAPPSVQPVDGGGDEAGRDAFDLAAELADELGDLGGEEPGPVAGGSDDYQVSVEEVFAEFKQQLGKVLKPEEVDAHYDMGIAFKEMELIDDAIGEFIVARQGCVGKKKEIDCLTMIGMLHMQKGEADQAVEAYKAALTNPSLAPDIEHSVRYDLAFAWEAAGSPGKALFHMLRVAASDTPFRDAPEQAERLAQVASPEDDELPEPAAVAAIGGEQGSGSPGGRSKASKVGYV